MVMTATLLERITGQGDAALGQWERDETWTKTNLKLAELVAQRHQHAETLVGARAAHAAAVQGQKRIAAAVLVGDENDRTFTRGATQTQRRGGASLAAGSRPRGDRDGHSDLAEPFARARTRGATTPC